MEEANVQNNEKLENIAETTKEKLTETSKENENLLLREQIKILTETINKLQKNLEIESKARQEAIQKLQLDKINSVISDAIQKGKIAPEKADVWRNKLLKNYNEFIEVLNDLPENAYLQASPKDKKEKMEISYSPKDLSHRELEKRALELMNNKLSQTIN